MLNGTASVNEIKWCERNGPQFVNKKSMMDKDIIRHPVGRDTCLIVKCCLEQENDT